MLIFNVSARCIINYSIDCTAAVQPNENFALLGTNPSAAAAAGKVINWRYKFMTLFGPR